MTITRIRQLTAETRSGSDVARGHHSVNDTRIASAQANTGSYSYELYIDAVQAGFASPSPLSALRMGYWFNHVGYRSYEMQGNSVALYRAAVGQDVFDSPNIRIQMDTEINQIYVLRPVPGTTRTAEILYGGIPVPTIMTVPETWVHYGVTHKIHATDGFLSLYINGDRILNYVGDTRPFGQGSGVNLYTLTASYIYAAGNPFTGVGGVDVEHNYLDDMYLDSYVGEADAAVPARRFLMALPNGAGADAEWTASPAVANYLNVDDNPNDGDTTQNKAKLADLRDTFSFSNITVPVDYRIIAAIPTAYTKRLDTDVANGITLHAYDGSTYEDSSDLELAMDYETPSFARFTQQPDGTDWNETDFNAMQWGYKSVGTF